MTNVLRDSLVGLLGSDIEAKKQAAWSKTSTPLTGNAFIDLLYRRDRFGSLISFSEYGNRQSEYGWEVDHIIPISQGGTDDLSNLQALHWRNNVRKGNALFGLLSPH